MSMTILICFKQNKRIIDFENKLKIENIFYDKQYISNFTFNDKDIQIVQYYIIYYNLIITNHEFFVKQYIKLHRILDKNEINKILITEYKRFDK